MEAELTPNGQKVFSLYKYVSLASPARKQHARAIFERDAVWLASPTSFNDPFDCKFVLSFCASTKAKKQMYYQYLTDPKGLQLPREVALKKMKELFSPSRPNAQRRLQAWEQDRRSHLMKVRETLPVLCLTELNDHILMWAHYADCHRGICLEFRFDLDEHLQLLLSFHRVRYQQEFPRLNFYTTPWGGPKFTLMALTKSEHWAYEKEWRWIDHGGPGERPLPTRMLWAVILGAQMPREDRMEVLQWNAARTHPLRVHQARLRKTEYGLDIERVDTSR